jgi:hypothetical protein
MTKLLEQAFAEASKLPDEDQDSLARQLLEDMAADRRWDELLADPRSSALLAELAAEAIAEDEAGETVSLEKFFGFETKPGVPEKVRPAPRRRATAGKKGLRTLAKGSTA